MREINVSEVEELVRDLCIKANLYLPEDMESCIECNAKKSSPRWERTSLLISLTI